MKRHSWLPAVAMGIAIISAGPRLGAEPPAAPADWKAQVEQDWLVQLELAAKGSRPSLRPTPEADAAGAVDGVKDGKWAFHTDADEKPWWQVDLGARTPIGRVVVYNRCDGTAARAARLTVLLSDDAKAWREVYRHDGTVFYGATDGKPLTVPLTEQAARYVRIQLPSRDFLHLDEVEVHPPGAGGKNLALGRPATQSSVSQWSTGQVRPAPEADVTYPILAVVAHGRRLADELASGGAGVEADRRALDEAAEAAARLGQKPTGRQAQAIYFKARWAARRLALANPLLDFDRIVFAKRVPGSYSHMSDQYYGWWSRPGGGLFVLEGFGGGRPSVRCLADGLAEGSVLRPDLSFDARRIVFAWCRYYPQVAGNGNKVAKDKLPEDAFYHVFEINVDGTALRQLTHGRYDDFDARYLPDGRIAFLSTRKGQFLQLGRASAAATTRPDCAGPAPLPDSYVRCGGGSGRPVAVYTLHTMDADGGDLRAISAFESFEWTPSLANDGRILYARWDYIDRSNMPFLSLWATHPDGANAQLVYGNFTQRPHCVFEARSIPNSRKLVFTASAHHSITGGSLVLLDPDLGGEGDAPLTRLTPAVCFPEVEGWPASYYANPLPLSERLYLTAWSSLPLRGEGGGNPPNALGLYLFDSAGQLELLYRDPAISSMYPLPLKARPVPPARPAAEPAAQDGRFLLADVYQGLTGIGRGTVRRLRIVGVTPKTGPQMNSPNLSVVADAAGKFVIGTVPVEADGSAYFRVPAGVPVFFQALDGDGLAVQTMRTVTYVQPGRTLGCLGCHEPRNLAPAVGAVPQAAARGPSRITPGPDGSWPLRFDTLVQPVMDKSCVSCHGPGGTDAKAAALDLTAANAYRNLIGWGNPSVGRLAGVRDVSVPGEGIARRSALLKELREGKAHAGVGLDADALARLTTWMDVYAHRLGSFDERQEQQLRELRLQWTEILEGD